MLTHRLQVFSMSEAEAYEIILLIASELSHLMFGYFSIVSAFLILSFLIAEKLNALQSAIILLLYTICSLFIVLNMYALDVDLDSLYEEMLVKKASGEYELAWFGKNPLWIPVSLTYIQLSIVVGGYIGSILFFFSKSKPEAGNMFGRGT